MTTAPIAQLVELRTFNLSSTAFAALDRAEKPGKPQLTPLEHAEPHLSNREVLRYQLRYPQVSDAGSKTTS